MIYKLQRENTAQIIIRQLPKLWNSITHFVTQLQNTNRTYSIVELVDIRNNFINNYTIMNNFNTMYGAWFASRYPEFAVALLGGIASLQSINDIIIAGLQNYYWDAELDVPVICNMSQNHRNALATSIFSELEE